MPTDWVALLSLVMFTLAAITSASWALYRVLTKSASDLRTEFALEARELRTDFIHQIESVANNGHKELDQVRQTLRDQDTKLETFRREMNTALQMMASKDDMRRIDTKLDQIIESAGRLAAEVSAIRARELHRSEGQVG